MSIAIDIYSFQCLWFYFTFKYKFDFLSNLVPIHSDISFKFGFDFHCNFILHANLMIFFSTRLILIYFPFRSLIPIICINFKFLFSFWHEHYISTFLKKKLHSCRKRNFENYGIIMKNTNTLYIYKMKVSILWLFVSCKKIQTLRVKKDFEYSE